ncbi:MAG: hypothetical protein M1320_02140 [Patescibacteria group bacterium]|nr:hypothetical protein [Patescibacteria group bacterium]
MFTITGLEVVAVLVVAVIVYVLLNITRRANTNRKTPPSPPITKTKIVIVIDNEEFVFDGDSAITVEDRYDLYIVEPNYEKRGETLKHQFTNKQIVLPNQIERRVIHTDELPCSKIFEDIRGNKRLYTYFD